MTQGNASTKFKYWNLYSWIVDKINDGSFAYNLKLPSEAELCEQFGVSRQTVRNALRQLGEDGYIFSVKGSGSFVRKHVRRREKRIGVIFSTVSGYICADILNGLENEFTSHGYSVQLEISHGRVESERSFLHKALDSHLSGVIIEATKSSFPSPNSDLFRQLDDAGIPSVFLNSYYSNVPCNAVIWDDENVSYKLTSQLIEAGHKNIACIFRCDEMQGGLRYLGYARAMLDHGLCINDSYVCWYSCSDGYFQIPKHQLDMIDSFLNSLKGNYTALICYNDLIAGSMINKLRAQNVQIPNDIAIASFDNSDLVQFFGLDSMYNFEHPKARLGEVAARLLLDLIHEDNTSRRQIITVTCPEENHEAE